MIKNIRQTTSILTALINNAAPLNIRRIVQSKIHTISHASDSRVWYAYINDPKFEKIIAIAETYIVGTGERLFSVRNMETQITEEQEITLLEQTANGAIDKATLAHTALSIDELIETLEGFTVENEFGMVDEIHPRYLVGEALNSTTSNVKSVGVWDWGMNIRLRSGTQIEILNARVDPNEPYDILFTVLITDKENPDKNRHGLFDAKQLRAVLPSYVYYGV